jgi:hypothetical protein
MMQVNDCSQEEKLSACRQAAKAEQAVTSRKSNVKTLIVPAFDTLLENASAWIDYQIKPYLAKFPWILPDSKSFCRDLHNVKIPRGRDIWLVTGDIVAMYPNIPIEDGIAHIASILGVPLMLFDNMTEAMNLDFMTCKELTVFLLRFVLRFNYVTFAATSDWDGYGYSMRANVCYPLLSPA